MKIYLSHLIESLKGKFWLIPVFCLCSASFLAWFYVHLDKQMFQAEAEPLSFLFFFHDKSNLRALLGTTAGAVLGVAGVAFSITVAALTLASQQFGPRLLRNFMHDRFNQIVIGFFIGTFLYCMLLLQFTSATAEKDFTPVISMMWLLAVIVVDLLLLVFFIHHTAAGIQADNIITRVYDELYQRLDEIFPDKQEDDKNLPALGKIQNDSEQTVNKTFNQQGTSVYAAQSGYLQAVDAEGLFAFALEKDISLRVNYHPGNFLICNCAIVTCLNADMTEETLQEKINSYFIIGHMRTPEQDPEYAIHQLVEVALRALSPGINDPFTAITCIHWLGNALSLLLERKPTTHQHFDEDGVLRLQLEPFSFPGMLDAAFNQIRQHGADDVAVILTLLKTLAELAQQTQNKDQANAIREKIQAVYQLASQNIQGDSDARTLEEYRDKAASNLPAH